MKLAFELVCLCLIYNILQTSSMTSSQFLSLVQGNWSFADLPSSTWAERKYKCNRKMDFQCDCKTASKSYDIGYEETTHPFCVENPTHGSCTGGCLDVHNTNFISSHSTQGACEGVKRVWTPPLRPRCRQENGNDVYSTATCQTELGCTQSCASLEGCEVQNSSCTQAFWEDVVVDRVVCAAYGLGDSCKIPAEGIDGSCKQGSSDVTETYKTKEQCLSAMTWIPALSITKTYYEMSKLEGGQFVENENRQCAAGEATQEKLGGKKECPYEDAFCNRYPKIDRVDVDNDNYNMFMLHSSFTKVGQLKQCNYLGSKLNGTELYDAQAYPLAPCPDHTVPYYCDFPQNAMFGHTTNLTGNSSTIKLEVMDTTCGSGLYNNESRQDNGLPHGIREYNNGYDRQAFQWSVEMEDPVSSAEAMNSVMTEMESVQMNIFSIGKLVDKKFILTSHREGFDESRVNEENAMELNMLFKLLAKTGDSVPISELKNETEVRQAAEWSPSDVDEDGLVSKLRCHSVPDARVDKFRTIEDVRRDFIDKFFAANKQQECSYGQAALDNETRSFERCDNSKEAESFLYPSTRKSFFNPITSDGFLSGYKKGQRFIKEISRSSDNIGVVEAGLRTMPDGTKVPQNATFQHIKFMMAMSTEQLEQCNTVTGHCRNIWYQFPRKTYKTAASALIATLTHENETSVEGCKMACVADSDCGGFELKVSQECKLKAASGARANGGGTYTDLRMEVQETPGVTAYYLERPNCEFRILGTRQYDAKNDGIDGLWGVSYDQKGGERWGYQTCRTSITVKKLEKIDAKDVERGLYNDPGKFFLDDYPYTILIQDEDCVDATIEMEEAVSQDTSAIVSLSEAQEVVKITASSTPDWCRTENGHYTGEQMQSQDGGVCLSHKQKQKSALLTDTQPFATLVSRQPQCLDESNKDLINLHPTKYACLKAAEAAGETWLWKDAINLEHNGREAACLQTMNMGQATCRSKGYIYNFNEKTCKKYHLANETECEHDWNPEVLATGTMGYITTEAHTAFVNGEINEAELALSLKYEDERLTCSDYGYIPQENGAQRSKYDRVRLVLWVDVLRLKDLYNEGKGASSIISRGIPVGLTEGYDSGCKDCNVREVGQHKLQSSDQDVVYYDAVEQKACTAAQLGGNCKEYSFATGYRATGVGDTFRGRTQTERDERNQIRSVIDKYLVRDVGLNTAGATGKPFWQDNLTTISYLGTATTSVTPLEESVQDLRENFGDSKIYNRYMIELFSDCLDRTRVQEHSSRLEFQIFKEGRLHGDRLRDSLPELSGGAWNAGMPKFDVTAEGDDALITTSATAVDFKAGDLITLSGCSTASDDGNYMIANISEVQEDNSIQQPMLSAVASDSYVDADTSTVDKTANIKAGMLVSGTNIAVGTKVVTAALTGDRFRITLSVAPTANIDADTVLSFEESSTGPADFILKATLAAFPTEPRAIGAALTGKTFSSGCKIAQKERECDGYSYDIRTDALLAKASPVYDSFQIATRDICGPVETDSTGCDFDDPSSCNYLKPCGSTIPQNVRDDYNWPATCSAPSGARCQICNRDTPQCYDGKGENVPDGALVGHTMHEDMQCAGFDYTNPNVKLGITTRKVDAAGAESRDNLDFVDIPVEQQTYGNIFGAELLEFSVGLRLLDTIDYEQDQYLKLKGMGSRTEVIAWLKNNRIGEMNNLRDVRDMGDLTYPQLTTEEVLFTVQTYDREQDPNSYNVNIESMSVCSHQPPSYFEPYIKSGAINRNVVNCITGLENSGFDAFGQSLSAAELANAPVGSDPCAFVYNTCPHKSGTGYSMKREEDDYFLLADYRPLFGNDGHLFVGDTCDMISVSRVLDMLTLPDMGNEDDNDLVYVNARNIPLQSSGGTLIAGSGRHAVQSACINPPSATGRAPEPSDFFKSLGPKDSQVPVSQTVVRNFRSMAIEDAKTLIRGIREVIPCRRLQSHGDDLSPEFANAVLYGYEDERSYGSLEEFGDRFMPKSCWRDGYITTCKEPHTDLDRTFDLDSKSKCEGSEVTKPRSTVSNIPNKCEEFAKGVISGTGIEIKKDGVTISDKETCLEQCEEQKFEKCIFYNGGANICKGDNGDQGNIQSISYDATSTNWVTNCSARTYEVQATAAGQFKGLVSKLNKTATDLDHAKHLCSDDDTCIGFHALPGPAVPAKCPTATANSELDLLVDVVLSFPLEYSGTLDSCMKLCKEKSADAEVIEHSASVCKCKKNKDGNTCSATASFAVVNHFIIEGKLGTSKRPVSYEFFDKVDPDDLGEEEAMSTRYYKVVEDACHWCTWSNADKRTHSNDSEDCMTNVLDHLKSATSFQAYMDNIGGSVNFEEEVCVQKNNLWREKGTKHIPCGYRDMFNFNMDSVYAPEGFVLTDEEKAYRLSENSPSWDAILFSPEDVGNIADHWEPVTKDFILPIKAEIVIHGSRCTADYDTTSGDSISNSRRRLLGHKQRIRVGRQQLRKLLQFDDASAMTPVAQFGGTTSSAFNIMISVTAENINANKVLGPNGEVLSPGDEGYQFVDKDGDGVQDDIYATVHKMHNADINCMGALNALWLGLGFVFYYAVVFLFSLILLGVPDEVTGKPMNIFFDVLAE